MHFDDEIFKTFSRLSICLNSNQESEASNKVEAITTTQNKDTVPSSSSSSSSSSESESGWVKTVPIDSGNQKSIGLDAQNSLEESSSISKIQAEEHEDDSYDPSNDSLIQDIEGLCSTNNVTFSWDFNNKKIKVTKK